MCPSNGWMVPGESDGRIIELYRNVLVAGWPASAMVLEMASITSLITLVAGVVVFQAFGGSIFDDYM